MEWKTVGFRVSPEEWDHFEKLVALTGSSKQDFLIKRIQQRDIIVNGNPRVAKALKNELELVLKELKRIEQGELLDFEILETIETITTIIDGLLNNEPIKRHSFKL